MEPVNTCLLFLDLSLSSVNTAQGIQSIRHTELKAYRTKGVV